MRHIAAVLCLALAACGQPLALSSDAGPAPGFNSCDPGSPDPNGTCSGGGGGGSTPTCFKTCNSNVECTGAAGETCIYCNFGECRSTQPTSLPEIEACRRACARSPRPRWCDEGGCALALRADGNPP